MDPIHRHICEVIILSDYDIVKKDIHKNGEIVCQYIGTFTQNILISFVSLLENYMNKSIASHVIQKRLTYLVVETIQNIIHHSYKHPDNSQLAYIIISKNKSGYTINTSNAIETISAPNLIDKVEYLLKTKKNRLPEIFRKKIANPEINDNGLGNLGLLTIISKSDKNFNYKISTMTSKYSLFHIEIKLNYKQ